VTLHKLYKTVLFNFSDTTPSRFHVSTKEQTGVLASTETKTSSAGLECNGNAKHNAYLRRAGTEYLWLIVLGGQPKASAIGWFVTKAWYFETKELFDYCRDNMQYENEMTKRMVRRKFHLMEYKPYQELCKFDSCSTRGPIQLGQGKKHVHANTASISNLRNTCCRSKLSL
jgi:hypothetical protein